MPALTVGINGEQVELDHENAMVYLFPTRQEMNHIYVNLGGRCVAIRDSEVLLVTLVSMGFPICSQVFPRQSEIDSYGDYLVSSLEGDLDGLDD